MLLDIYLKTNKLRKIQNQVIDLSKKGDNVCRIFTQNLDFRIVMETDIGCKMLIGKYKKLSKPPLSNISRAQTTQQLNCKGFIFDSSDQHIKKILTNNGWKVMREGPALLKWVYQPRNNTFSQLHKTTLINHFPHSHILTTKLGLCRTLRGERTAFINQFGKTHLRFYPRSYDLSQENQAFIKDFRQTAIVNLSKKMMIGFELSDQQSFIRLKEETSVGVQNKEVNWLKELRVLYQNKEIYSNGATTSKSFLVNAKIFESLLYYLCLMFTLDCQVNQEIVSEGEINNLVVYSQLNPPYHSLQQHYGGDKTLAKNPSKKALKLFLGLYSQLRNRLPWFRADGLRNIWVVKGSDSSRGRSIVLVSDLQELKMLNSGTKLIQKYVEDTWIIHQANQEKQQKYTFLGKILGKKFDIRIWVLVKSFAPLQAYVYTQGYLRISQEEYQLLNINRDKTHLTNFSVNWKDSEGDPQNSYVLLSEFLDFLEHQGYKTRKTFMKQLHSVIKNTLEAGDLAVTTSDKRCFQLYGFDILLDSELNPWLLEVNMSPACKERGRLAIQLERMGRGLLSIIGLIEDNTNQTRWIRLDFGQTQSKRGKQKKQNINPMAKSQCEIRPILSKLRNLNSGEDQDSTLSRVNSLLPSIANSQSLYHNKAEVFSSQMTPGLIVLGSGLPRKNLRTLDTYLAIKTAVMVLQKHFLKYLKAKRQNQKARKGLSKSKRQPALNWLALFVCVNKVVKRGMGKCLKRLVKAGGKKKQFNIRKSLLKFDLNL